MESALSGSCRRSASTVAGLPECRATERREARARLLLVGPLHHSQEVRRAGNRHATLLSSKLGTNQLGTTLMATPVSAAKSGTFRIGSDMEVHRLGFGTMRLTGRGIWGPPADHAEALRTLKR